MLKSKRKSENAKAFSLQAIQLWTTPFSFKPSAIAVDS